MLHLKFSWSGEIDANFQRIYDAQYTRHDLATYSMPILIQVWKSKTSFFSGMEYNGTTTEARLESFLSNSSSVYLVRVSETIILSTFCKGKNIKQYIKTAKFWYLFWSLSNVSQKSGAPNGNGPGHLVNFSQFFSTFHIWILSEFFATCLTLATFIMLTDLLTCYIYNIQIASILWIQSTT